MYNPQDISQSSSIFDEYFPHGYPFQDQMCPSYDDLLRLCDPDTSLPSEHRSRSESFDRTSEDATAIRIFTNDDDDELFPMDTSECDENNIENYLKEQSNVIPHTPNLSNKIYTNISYPLSPSLIDISKHQQNNRSPPSSPIYSNHMYLRTFYVFDENTGRERRPYLYEFIRLLLDDETYSHIIEYTDRKQGIFKLKKPNHVAELWQQVKGRNSDNQMTYDKIARALRHYYSNSIMHPSSGRFTFRFGDKSGFGTTWW